MKRLSRRSLIGGIGTATALGVAGCIGSEDDDQSPDDEETPDDGETPDDSPDDEDAPGGESALPEGLLDTFGFVYPPDGSDATILRAGQPRESEGILYTDPTDFYVSGDSEIDWVIRVEQPESQESFGFVATGTIELEDSDELDPQEATHGFDRYEIDDPDAGDEEVTMSLATDGGILLAGRRSWVDRTLDSHEADETTYLEANDRARELLETIDVRQYNVVLADDGEIIAEDLQGEKELSTVPELFAFGGIQTEDTIELAIAARYAEPVDESEVAEFEDLIAADFGIEDAEAEQLADGRILRVEHSREYVPPEERPERPRFPRYAGYDSDSGAVLFEFTDGDSLPVERFEIEIDDEVYDGDWARGQDEIGEGSVIAIDADAIEPGDTLTVSYEGDGHSGAATTTVLRRLPFRVQYDPNERRATVEYVDGLPLSAEKTVLRLGDDRTLSPWDGQVTAGDSVTVEDAELGTELRVVYERPDGGQMSEGGDSEGIAVSRTELRPPGYFEFEYDAPARELTVSYPEFDAAATGGGMRHHPRPEPRPVPADEYEIRVDGEPAGTQLADAGEEFEPGDSVSLADVPIDAAVEVVWLGDDGTTFTMDETRTVPDVSFEFEYDDGAVVIRHAGGMTVDADPLDVELLGQERETVEWDATGTVTEGDQFVVEDVEQHGVVLVQYNGRTIADRHVAELIDEDDGSDGSSASGGESGADGSGSDAGGSGSSAGGSASAGRLTGGFTQ